MQQNLHGRIQDIQRFQSKVEDLISLLRQPKVKNKKPQKQDAKRHDYLLKFFQMENSFTS